MNQITKPSERAIGRPVETSKQDLKTQILDTAEAFFAEYGYAATSIRRIADHVKVNTALVHYYFGNKKALLQKVMERALEPLGNAIAAMKDDPEASPYVIARLLLSMASQHPNIPRLMTREVFLPGGEMQQYFTENMAPHLGGALPALLGRERAAGRLRKDADLSVTALLILAVCVFPFIAQSLAEPVLGVKFDDDGIKLLGQQVTQLLTVGLAP